jgi:hydroxymethylpyrimidine kinase/phosphomethylpyrimidine kinase
MIEKMEQGAPAALTIAGSDSSGGAGIQADLKTFSSLGCYGASVITGLTAQNTLCVSDIQVTACSNIMKQMEAVFTDLDIASVKVGALFNEEVIRTVAAGLRTYRPRTVIIDPVMVSKTGSPLLDKSAVAVFKEELLPLATLLTPNVPEAEVLSGIKITNTKTAWQAAGALVTAGSRAVLLKGGHRLDIADEAVDFLADGKGEYLFSAKRSDKRHTHGTGCTLSSAIAGYMALGKTLTEAISEAKLYITAAIEHAYPVGRGVGPVNHFWQFYSRKRIFKDGSVGHGS